MQKKCKAPQLDMPAEIVAGQSDTLTLSDRKWWEVYTDTTLCRLIGRTLDRNRNMLSAEARIRQLEELYRVSRCKVGLMQRPERVVVTAVTAMLTGCMADIWWLAGGMILIAVLANITAFWRIAHCYIVMNKKEAE